MKSFSVESDQVKQKPLQTVVIHSRGHSKHSFYDSTFQTRLPIFDKNVTFYKYVITPFFVLFL